MAVISSENLRTYRNYSRERLIKKVMKYKGPRYFISVNEEKINDEIVTSAIFVGKEKGDIECIVLEEIIDYGMEYKEIENYFFCKYKKKRFDK